MFSVSCVLAGLLRPHTYTCTCALRVFHATNYLILSLILLLELNFMKILSISYLFLSSFILQIEYCKNQIYITVFSLSFYQNLCSNSAQLSSELREAGDLTDWNRVHNAPPPPPSFPIFYSPKFRPILVDYHVQGWPDYFGEYSSEARE